MQHNLCSPPPERMTLMIWNFLVNQNHAAQPVWSNSQNNDSFDLVLFSESKTHNATNVTKTIQLNN